ncbi:AAA family ATPase [Egibacter rhizosphaerae]|uniref:AAA family ATPase n=1 Tax=Egibacter rhizosphaerae TaxID=1670831 RepID=UPI0013F16A7E|nr:hypothetical protein [Egibacter rhizosphaerae]
MGERFVLLGLGQPRAEWFRTVAAWATSGALPAEFLKCVSAEELRAHLSSSRIFSAALLDAGLPATDRELIGAVRDAGAVPIVVEAPGVQRDWSALGAVAVLPAQLEREDLLDTLGAHAPRVSTGEALPREPSADDGPPREEPAPVVTVCGPGGTGASTAAIALAQGLASEQDARRPVLLADLCLRAEQAMLHDARDVVPGVQELVEVHRGNRPTPGEVHAQTFRVVERGYHLLLGLRRPRYWSALRPRSFSAAFASLRQAFGTVVCDVTADFEGEADGGSMDVEERNLMSRTALGEASVVLAVGGPDMKGLHGLARLLAELREAGADDERVVPVINRAPRQGRRRAALAGALQELVPSDVRSAPVLLPRRRVDEALRDGVPLPGPLPDHLRGAFRATLERAGAGAREAAGPEPVVPGSLGAFAADVAIPGEEATP